MGVILLSALVLCEIAVRARAWIKYGTHRSGIADEMLVFDPNVGLSYPRPGYQVSSQNISIKINALGFRGEEVARDKPPGTLRIVTIGASTTFCAEVSGDHATWPHQLQEALQRQYPDVRVEVINAGVPGYVATESLKNLQRRVLPLKPDLVIFYEANNDMANDTRELARRQGLIASSAGHVSRPAKMISDYSLLFDLLYKNWKIMSAARSDAVTGKLAAIPPDLPARFIGEIDKMRDELHKHDVAFVLSRYLVKYRRDQDRATQLANASVSFYYMPWMTMEGLLDGVDAYNEAIVQYARSHGLPVVDDRDSVPADDAHYVDWAHMTDRGCQRMAERFRRYLVENNIIPRILSTKRRADARVAIH